MIRSVCVFCGSRSGANPRFVEDSVALGRELAGAGTELIYGGGHVGLMGMMADAALAAGGRVTGVIPRSLFDREVAHEGLTTLHVTDSMHARKAKMADLADAFVALPGGFGTLDELCEIITWAQLGLHGKPIVLLNTEGFWDGFLAFIDEGVRGGFIPDEHRTMIKVVTTARDVLPALKSK